MDDQQIHRFLVIDDDPINNHICSKYIQIIFPDAEITTFTDPQAGLDHIYATFSMSESKNTTLLLDINMPVLSGWEVLDRFNDFPDVIKQQIKIYILSSSVAIEDKQKASDNQLVSGFIEKPLTIPQLKTIFSVA